MAAGEVNFVGVFRNPYSPPEVKAKKVAECPQDRTCNVLGPDDEDLREVVKSGHGTNPVSIIGAEKLLAKILGKGRGSIRTLNIFTHGSPEGILLHGKVRPHHTTLGFDFVDIEPASEPGAAITKAYIEVELLDGPFDLEGVRRRFAKGAKVVVYACQTGGASPSAPDPEFLQALANLFDRNVIGFKNFITVCAQAGRRPLGLKYTIGIGNAETVCGLKGRPGRGVADFHQIIPAAQGQVIERTPSHP